MAGPSGLLSACGGDGPTDPGGGGGGEKGPAPKTSMLLPLRQYLPLQGGLTLPFESPDADGETFTWEVRSPGGGSVTGDGRTFSHEFTSTGSYEIRFVARSTGWPDATAVRVVEILPPIADQSRTKVAWWVSVGGGACELRVADDWRNLDDFRSFGPVWGDTGQFFHGIGQSSWSRDQSRLAVSVQDGAWQRIAWVDVTTGEVEVLTEGGGNALAPVVSPSGEFIAYSDTLASIQLAPQLWVMRPDGSGKVRVGGVDGEQFSASGTSIAWLPDESAILIGTRFNGLGGPLTEGANGLARRVCTVRNFLGGSPVIEPIHTASKLITFARSTLAIGESLSTDEIRSGGEHSMAFHPNGEEVIYPLRFTVEGFQREVMVAEGIGGGIRLVSTSDGSCTVSPDGNEVWLHDTTLTSDTTTLIRAWQSGGPVSTLATGVRGATMIR